MTNEGKQYCFLEMKNEKRKGKRKEKEKEKKREGIKQRSNNHKIVIT